MTALDERIAALGAKFAARAPEEMAGLKAALDRGDIATLVDRAHKLAGIAGMFGHHEIGAAALAVEETAIAGGDPRQAAAELVARLAAI